MPDERVNSLNIPAGGVQVNNDSMRQFDWLGTAEDDVTYGSAFALCDKTPVRQVWAVNEAPIEKSRVARKNHAVISSRSLPELVNLGAEAINLDDSGGCRRTLRLLYEVAQPEQRVGEKCEEQVELKYAAAEACHSVCPAMVSRAYQQVALNARGTQSNPPRQLMNLPEDDAAMPLRHPAASLGHRK